MIQDDLGISHAPALDTLHQKFAARKLEVVVGAGASVPAGLPRWAELNRRLLSQFLRARYADLQLDRRDLDRISLDHVLRFGRDAVVDLVREQLQDPDAYRQALRAALYPRPLEPSEIHLELATWLRLPDRGYDSGLDRLVTFNFDTLIEHAVRKLRGPDGLTATTAIPEVGTGPYVLHPHGILDENGGGSGQLVLSEKDYYQTADHVGANALENILLQDDEEVAVLFVGTSMADSRVRNALFKRLTAARRPEVYVLQRISTPPEGADLASRLGHALIREHERDYWHKGWEVNTIPYSHYEVLGYHLRKIRLPGDCKDWLIRGAGCLQIDDGTLYNKHMQDVAQAMLGWMIERLCGMFGSHMRSNEKIRSDIFVVTQQGTLKLAFDTNRVERDEATLRTLEIGKDADTAQGAAGFAMATGATISARRGSPLFDRRFTHDMDWEPDFASVLCVPVYGGPHWLPYGVVCLTSNQEEPFWTRLDPRAMDETEVYMRNVFIQTVPGADPQDE